MKQLSRKQIILRIGTALLAVLVLFALGMFLRAARINARSQANFRELSELVVRNTPAPAAPAPTPGPTAAPIAILIQPPAASPDPGANAPAPTATPAPTAEPTLAPLEDYAALYARNPDFFGWITVADTRVDLPIMYSPDRPLQYLGHDFDGNFSYAGVPYLAPQCDPDGDYYLIYGHHMRDGSVFAGLMAYEDRAFWEQHPTFRCDTRFERRTYAVIAAFRARVLTQDERGFRYYSYSALSDEATFNTFMTNIRAMAAYDTGITAAFGDQILTLTTCAYHTEKGRFVVVAKRID